MRLKPTFKTDNELFGLFALAEKLGKTVSELLTGKPQPLSNAEFTYWSAFWIVRNEMEEKASKGKAPNKEPPGPRMKKTMG